MKYSKAERAHHLAQQSSSGLSMKAYCVAHGINYFTFYGWHREKKKQRLNSSVFVEISAPEAEVKGGMHIYLPNGIRIELHQSLDRRLLKCLCDV